MLTFVIPVKHTQFFPDQPFWLDFAYERRESLVYKDNGLEDQPSGSDLRIHEASGNPVFGFKKPCYVYLASRY